MGGIKLMCIFLLLWCKSAFSETDCPDKCICDKSIDYFHLNCSWNQFHDFKIPKVDSATFVNFSYNKFEHLNPDSELEIVKNMDVSFNQIRTISDKFHLMLSNLEVLNLTHNCIQLLPQTLPEKLKVLKLSHNNIQSVNWTILTQLKHLQSLYLEYNQIKEIEFNFKTNFVPFQKLSTISLKSNNIKTISNSISVVFRNIRKISFENNSLTKILNDTFKDLVYVQYLDLSSNVINFIDPHSFSANVQLKYLFLSNNLLNRFPQGLPMLEWLDMSSNNITKIFEHQSSDLYPQEVFLIGENPFHCDCELLWLKEFYDSREYIKDYIRLDIGKFVPICASPVHLVGDSWDVLDDSAFGCTHEIEATAADSAEFLAQTDISLNSWRVSDLFVKLEEISDTYILIRWNSLTVKTQTSKEVIFLSIHPFGKKNLQNKLFLDIKLEKYVIRDLEPNSAYVICVSVVALLDSEDVLKLKSNMAVTLDDCHELVTKKTVIKSHSISFSVIFYIVLFLISFLLVYYCSVWAFILKHFFNFVQFIQTDYVKSNAEAKQPSNEKSTKSILKKTVQN